MFALVGSCIGQELSPRAYWPAPEGTNILALGYVYQTGDIVTDPSLPIFGVDSTIHTGVVAYQRTLNVFGRTSNLQFQLPLASGTTTGVVNGDFLQREVDGIGDFSTTWSVNLMGAPTMTPEEFRGWRSDPQPILAASIRVLAPTGQYDADRLINIGTNRWAVRAHLGHVRALGPRWLLEASAGIWYFQDNDDFQGETRKQDPISTLELSLIHRFKPGFWASFDLNYYLGGRTRVGADAGADFQRNSRAGITLVYPFKPRHAIKLAFSGGVTTESGGDFRSVNVNYIRLF
jgi:hypothetical protein